MRSIWGKWDPELSYDINKVTSGRIFDNSSLWQWTKISQIVEENLTINSMQKNLT